MDQSKSQDRAKSRRAFLRTAAAASVASAVEWRAQGQKAKSSSNSSIYLVEEGMARGPIIVGNGATDFDHWLSAELQRYLEILSGAKLSVISEREISDRYKAGILLGGPAINGKVRELAQRADIDFQSLPKDGFVLERVADQGTEFLIVGGNDEASTMYAAYDLLERYGFLFQISGDIPPEPSPDVELLDLSVRAETPFSRRGFLIGNIYPNRSIWSFEECASFLDQMAKSKMNYLQFFCAPDGPWLMYSFRGEQKLIGDATPMESGYMLPRDEMGTFLTSAVQIGRQHFRYQRLAPPEFERVSSPQEAHRVARSFLKRIIDHAHKRKIEVWLMTDPSKFPANLARYAKRTGPRPFHPVQAAFACLDDPVVDELTRIRLTALFETYPEADGYFLTGPEQYPVCEETDASVFDRYRPLMLPYEEIVEHYPCDDCAAEIVASPFYTRSKYESDTSLLYYLEKVWKMARQINPRAKIGIAHIGRIHLLPPMDKIFPSQVSFSDMESRGVWTPRGVPMHYFADMGERERTLIPRLDDDAAMLGLQFNATLYYKDRVLDGSLEYGGAGFAAQLNRARGTEHNARFLAEGAWNPELTPEQFYRSYVTRLFGRQAAAPIVEAYLKLEEHEEYLGWRGQGNFPQWGHPREITIMKRRFRTQLNPYDGPHFDGWDDFVKDCRKRHQIFGGSLEMLGEALAKLLEAGPRVRTAARRELDYLVNKTEAYMLHFELVRLLEEGYISYDEAFQIKARNREAAFRDRLVRCQDLFQAAHRKAREVAEKEAEFIDHPSDVAILFELNSEVLTATEEFAKFIKNVVNFHHGLPYWEEVRWHRWATRYTNEIIKLDPGRGLA